MGFGLKKPVFRALTRTPDFLKYWQEACRLENWDTRSSYVFRALFPQWKTLNFYTHTHKKIEPLEWVKPASKISSVILDKSLWNRSFFTCKAGSIIGPPYRVVARIKWYIYMVLGTPATIYIINSRCWVMKEPSIQPFQQVYTFYYRNNGQALKKVRKRNYGGNPCRCSLSYSLGPWPHGAQSCLPTMPLGRQALFLKERNLLSSKLAVQGAEVSWEVRQPGGWRSHEGWAEMEGC